MTAAAPQFRRAGRDSSDPYDDEQDPLAWLDTYEEGSTAEEVLDRVKRGMLLFRTDTPADIIAAVVADGFPRVP